MIKDTRVRELASGRADQFIVEVNKGDGTWAALELASATEAAAGTDKNKVITPETLSAAATTLVSAASATVAGKVELATDAEAITGTDATRAVTPANLAAAVTTHVTNSSTSVSGKIQCATAAYAKLGTAVNFAVTPASLMQGRVTSSVLLPAFAINYRPTPALGTATAVHAAITLPDVGTLEVTDAITSPDYPRVVTVTGNQAGVAGNVVIDGTDFNGDVIQDTIALNAGSTVNGAKAFKTVTKITVPVKVGGGDTVSVGTANIFGLPHAIYAECLLAHYFNGANDAGSLAVSATLSQNLYTIAGTPDGAKVLAFLYMV